MKVNRNNIVRIYKTLRMLALKAYKNKKDEDCLEDIFIAAKIMYKCNLIFADNGLENILYHIGKRYVDKELLQKIDNHIIFYDYFGLDNRGLALIYIKALYELGYHITYIVCQSQQKNYERTAEYVRKSGGKIFVIRQDTYKEQMKAIMRGVKSSCGTKVLLQTAPYDVAGLSVFSALEGKLERFLINITDHAYWLGKKSFDKCVEFRNIGIAISTKYRKIEKEKLTYLPYYPATNNTIEFQGFPFDPEGKKIIYSGGSLYKISGSNKYYEIVKYILDHYPDTVILFTGNGDAKEILDFIADHHYEKRFYYQQERKDFEYLIKECYFYLSTYPIGGGLMTQYAVYHNVLPLCLTDEKEDLASIFVNKEKVEDIFFYDIGSLFIEIDKIMTDSLYLQEKKNKLQGAIIREEQFKEALHKLLTAGDTELAYSINGFDVETVRKQHLKGMGISKKELRQLLSRDSRLLRKFILNMI